MINLNRGTKVPFDLLVCNSYAIAKGYLERDIGNQSAEHCHRTFFTLFLCGKFCEAVRLVCEQDPGGGLLPDDMVSNKMSFTEETVAIVL